MLVPIFLLPPPPLTSFTRIAIWSFRSVVDSLHLATFELARLWLPMTNTLTASRLVHWATELSSWMWAVTLMQRPVLLSIVYLQFPSCMTTKETTDYFVGATAHIRSIQWVYEARSAVTSATVSSTYQCNPTRLAPCVKEGARLLWFNLVWTASAIYNLIFHFSLVYIWFNLCFISEFFAFTFSGPHRDYGLHLQRHNSLRDKTFLRSQGRRWLLPHWRGRLYSRLQFIMYLSTCWNTSQGFNSWCISARAELLLKASFCYVMPSRHSWMSLTQTTNGTLTVQLCTGNRLQVCIGGLWLK